MDRLEILRELSSAPDWALFNEHAVAAARGVSVKTIQYERLHGMGVPFLKVGRRVQYRRDDILAFINGLQRRGAPQARPVLAISEESPA